VEISGKTGSGGGRKIPAGKLSARLHFYRASANNKVKRAVIFFDLIQSVDSLSLAETITRKAEAIK